MDVTLLDLWLPILLATAAVFFLSFVMWALLPWHTGDWGRVDGEAELMQALDQAGAKPGQYHFPWAPPAEAQSPEHAARLEREPSGFLIVRPRTKVNMGAMMGQSILFNLLVTVAVAWVLSETMSAGGGGSQVMRVGTVVSFLAFGAAEIWQPIWFGRSWSSTTRSVVDAIIYGVAQGALFALMWPAAVA